MTALTRARTWSVNALFAVGFVAVWQGAVWAFGIPRYLLPGPGDVVSAATANTGRLLTAAGETTTGVALGFVFGNLIGFLAALAIAASRTASQVVLPIALGLRSIPVIALAPFLTLYLGRGTASLTAVAALIVFFPTLVNGLLGLRSADREVFELMRVLNASRWETFAHVRLPASLPYLFAAFRISAPSSVLGVMVAEWVVSGGGLGYLILSTAINAQTALMWAAVLLSTTIAGIAFALVALAERRVVRWGALPTV